MEHGRRAAGTWASAFGVAGLSISGAKARLSVTAGQVTAFDAQGAASYAATQGAELAASASARFTFLWPSLEASRKLAASVSTGSKISVGRWYPFSPNASSTSASASAAAGSSARSTATQYAASAARQQAAGVAGG